MIAYEKPRPANGTGPQNLNLTSSVATVIDQLDHFQRRVLADALQEATAGYWRRRAAAFDAVGTPACDEIAQACRNRAAVSLLGGESV